MKIYEFLENIGFRPMMLSEASVGDYVKMVPTPVYLERGHITIFHLSTGEYNVNFYYNKGSYDMEVKRLRMNIQELENLLLNSIICGSFLTTDEESKIIKDPQIWPRIISWKQYASVI